MAYLIQARDAILALKERSGSSLPALKKYMNLSPDKFRHLNLALKNGVSSGALVKVGLSPHTHAASPQPTFNPPSTRAKTRHNNTLIKPHTSPSVAAIRADQPHKPSDTMR